MEDILALQPNFNQNIVWYVSENRQPKRPRNNDLEIFRPTLNTLQYVDLYDKGNWEKLQNILDKPCFEPNSKKPKLQSDVRVLYFYIGL